MPGFDGTGPRGMGPLTGGGRGFCAVPLPAAWPAYPSYGMPYYGVQPAAPAAFPYGQSMTREQELEFLKNQTQTLKGHLERIEARIEQLTAGS